jgi:hypothetical protein
VDGQHHVLADPHRFESGGLGVRRYSTAMSGSEHVPKFIEYSPSFIGSR